MMYLMGCDHPSFVPIGPLRGELWHFQYFPTWRPSAILSFKNFTIWSRHCHCGPNLLLCTKFYQNRFTCSASRRHNNWMFNAPLLGNGQRPSLWQPHHGRHVGNTIMGCDHPSFIPIGPLVSELWYFQYFPIRWPYAILNFKKFNIWSRGVFWCTLTQFLVSCDTDHVAHPETNQSQDRHQGKVRCISLVHPWRRPWIRTKYYLTIPERSEEFVTFSLFRARSCSSFRGDFSVFAATVIAFLLTFLSLLSTVNNHSVIKQTISSWH